MAQLKVKQISDFVSAVTGIHNGTVGTAAGSAIGDAKSEAISTAVSADVVVKSEAISAAVSADVVVKSQAISTAFSADVVAKSEAIASAKSYTDAEVVKVNAKITTEKERIDAILLSADADKDSFAEIVELINSVDLTNDNALGTAVLSLATVDTGLASRISDLENSSANGDDLTALEARVTTNEGDISTNASDISALDVRVTANEGDIRNIVDIDITNINATLNSFGDIVTYNYIDVTTDIETAYNNAVTESTRLGNLAYDSLGSAAAALADAKTYADTAEADAKSYAAGIVGDEETARIAADDALSARIDALAGVSSDEVVAVFGSETTFSTGVQFALDGHLVVFVNGLQIHEAAEGIDGWRSVDGRNFTVEGLGYDLEADDHIIVSGTLA